MRADAVKREIRITMPNYTPTSTVAMDFVAQETAVDRRTPAKRARCSTDFAPGTRNCGGRRGASYPLAVKNCRGRLNWGEGDVAGRRAPKQSVGGTHTALAARPRRAASTRSEIASLLRDARAKPVPTPVARRPAQPLGKLLFARDDLAQLAADHGPPHYVRRSVIAHEVAHMRHMDHSPEFLWLARPAYTKATARPPTAGSRCTAPACNGLGR